MLPIANTRSQQYELSCVQGEKKTPTTVRRYRADSNKNQINLTKGGLAESAQLFVCIRQVAA